MSELKQTPLTDSEIYYQYWQRKANEYYEKWSQSTTDEASAKWSAEYLKAEAIVQSKG